MQDRGSYALINIPGEDFECAGTKNQKIRDTDEPWMIFANQSVADAAEVSGMLQEYGYMESTRLLVLCDRQPCAADWYGLLMEPGLTVYAMVIDRTLFGDCGPFNERLEDETNREWLIRASLVCEPLFLPCSDVGWQRSLRAGVWESEAYLLVRYLGRLGHSVDQALARYLDFAAQHGAKAALEERLEELLGEDREPYERLYLATAPFLVIRGNETCYGILQSFADQLTAALRALGQRVIETDGMDAQDKDLMELLKTEHFRAIIGFQATILFQPGFDFVKGRRFHFWFDHPMFFHGLFERMSRPCTFLCQDEDHAAYINRYFPMATALWMSPGADPLPESAGEKPYDISFMGTYFDEAAMWQSIDRLEGDVAVLCRQCTQALLEHVDLSYNDLRLLLEQQYPGLFVQYSMEEIAGTIWEACRIPPYAYRRRTVEKILESGYELHVYGDSWKAYPVKPGERLVIHEEIPPALMSGEMGKAKISLNVMSWHKAGMTERIIEILHSGSVCLTDETRYLREHFTQMEELVMFRLDELEQLPELIDRLLGDDRLREEIAANGRKRAMEHTWDARARQLLELCRQMEEKT